MSTRNLPVGKVRLTCESDNLTTIYEPNVWKMWDPRRLKPPKLQLPVTEIATSYLLDTIKTYILSLIVFKRFCVLTEI
jgi:hypothetical protein